LIIGQLSGKKLKSDRLESAINQQSGLIDLKMLIE